MDPRNVVVESPKNVVDICQRIRDLVATVRYHALPQLRQRRGVHPVPSSIYVLEGEYT